MFGLTDKRYKQLLSVGYDDEDIEMFVEDWGVDAVNKGYDIFDFGGEGILEIERIDELQVFDSDREATEQAIKDGVKIIPIDELPKELAEQNLNYLGWIDTPENRKALKEYFD